MTRAEAIWRAADNSECRYYEDQYRFVKGAEWADEHPKSPWISVKDELPKNGTFVLIVNPREQFATFYDGIFHPMHYSEIEWNRMVDRVTHWMPIPPLNEE